MVMNAWFLNWKWHWIYVLAMSQSRNSIYVFKNRLLKSKAFDFPVITEYFLEV